jgi:hypothetical protein
MLQENTVEKIKTHVSYSKQFFPENCAFGEIMWQNTGQPERSQMAI